MSCQLACFTSGLQRPTCNQQRRTGAGRRLAAPCRTRRSAAPTASASASAPPAASTSAAGLPLDHQDWAACRQLLQHAAGLDAAAADEVLAEACGWRGQGYWRRERVKVTPDPAAISATLDYLASLGLSPEDLAAMLAEQPELAGLDVELLQKNVATLQQKWFLKGKYLTGAVKRKPKMLGCLIDCAEDGSCQGLCTRCWAQC